MGNTTIIGIIAVFVMMIISIAMDGMEALKFYLNTQSVLITFGGAFLSVFAMCRSIKVFGERIGSVRAVFHKVDKSNDEVIEQIIDFAHLARKEGLLSLEEEAEKNTKADAFLRKGLLLVVNGSDAEELHMIMKNEIDCIDIRHNENIEFWEKLASMGPAYGMIGTLIGLINMLLNMGEDSAAIGPAMATALMTTFYGSVLANAICTPIAERLRAENDAEILRKELILQGVSAIQNGDNPYRIEEKLRVFEKETKLAQKQEFGKEVPLDARG